MFSFNSPYGACEECEGIGMKLNVDPNLVIPDDRKTIADGAIEPWSKSTTLYYAQTLASIAKHYKISMSDPWRKISKKIQDIILYGSDEEEIKCSYDDGYETYTSKKTFEGVINNLERRFVEKIGLFNPLLPKDKKERIKVEAERVKYWISKGAKPTLRVSRILGEAQLMPMPKPGNNPQKAVPKKERKKTEETKKILLNKKVKKLLNKKQKKNR